MAVNLAACNFTVSGQASLLEDLSLYTPDGTVQIGSGGFGSITLSLTNGTGDNEANQMFAERITVPSAGGVVLNLCDGSLKNFRGQAITFERIKLVVIAVVDPDGDKVVTVGPEGLAAGARLWFQDASGSDQVLYAVVQSNLKTGWAVSPAGEREFSMTNNGPDDVQVDVVIIGVDS